MNQGKKLPPNGISELGTNEQHLQLPLKSEETPSSSGRSRRTPRMMTSQQNADKQNTVLKTVSLFYLNVQIEAKVYQTDTWTSFICRVVYIMGADEDKKIGFVPISKIIPTKPTSQEEEKVTASKKGNAAESGSTPHSYQSRDLVTSLEGLQSDQVYYLVYLRQKTQAEQDAQLVELNEESPMQSGKSASSRRASPRKKVVNYFKRLGIKLPESYSKTQRSRGQKKPLFCPFVSCLRDFQETGNLKTHLRIHTGERPFACAYDDCGKRFITKGHLKTHELIHTGDKPFTCEHCGKSYSRTGRLKIHKRTHLGQKPFMCDFQGCGKSFTEKGNLKTHQRIHNGEKPFLCNYVDCGRSFTTHGHLSDHYRRHTGERPFKCEQCDQSFMRSSTLKIHLRRHTGEKPFVCDTCGKNFAESGNLRTHKKIHVNCLPGTQINDKCFSSAAKIAIGTIGQHQQKPAKFAVNTPKDAKTMPDCLTTEAKGAQQPGVTSMFNKKQEEKDTVGIKRPRPKQLTMLLNKHTVKDGGAAASSNNVSGDNMGKAENLQLQKQQMTFAAPQTYSLPGLQGGMSRFPSTASGAKIPIRVKNSSGAIVNNTPATQAAAAGNNSGNHIFTNSSKSGSNQSGSLTDSAKSSNPSAAGEKRRAKAQEKEDKVVEKEQQLRHISPPQGALKPIQAEIPWKFPVSVERNQEGCQQDPEKAVSINLNAMFHEVIRTISRDNSERMLIENPVEPTTPISHGFVVQMPSQQNLFYPSRGISHPYGNNRGDNSIKRKKFITLQNSTSPMRMTLDYSPDNSAAAQNLNQQMPSYIVNQGVGAQGGGGQNQQPLQIYSGATPAELIKKLVPMSGYSDAFNSNDRTPRSSMNQNFPSEKNTGQQTHAQLQQQMRSDSQQFEDQISSSYFQQNSFHTATFQNETQPHVQEGSIEGSQKPQIESEQIVKMDLSMMKKNFSLNSQFDLKNIADAGLTKTINSFQTSRINQVGPKMFQSLTPTEMFLLRTPEQNRRTASIKNITQADQADQQLPQSMVKAKQPSMASFNSVGKMALAKLQQYQAQKNTESESNVPATNNYLEKNRGGSLEDNTASMMNNNDIVSPNCKFQYQPDKSPGLLPTPLNNNFRVAGNGNFPFRQPKGGEDLTNDSLNFAFLSDNIFKKDGQPALDREGSARNLLNNNHSQVSTGFQLIAHRKLSVSHTTSVMNSNSKEKEGDVEPPSPPQGMSDRKPLAMQREETFASVSAAKESEQLMKGAGNMH